MQRYRDHTQCQLRAHHPLTSCHTNYDADNLGEGGKKFLQGWINTLSGLRRMLQPGNDRWPLKRISGTQTEAVHWRADKKE